MQGHEYYYWATAGLFDALLAEASALGGSLAGLEFRIALTDDVKSSVALDDLAVFVALLHGHK